MGRLFQSRLESSEPSQVFTHEMKGSRIWTIASTHFYLIWTEP